MKNYIKLRIILLIVAAVLIGCSKESTTPEPSSDCSIKNFSFLKADNPSLNANFLATGNDNIFYITLPQDVNLNSLVPAFTANEKAVVTCGTTEVESGNTALDFSSTLTLTVRAETGSTKKYYILARNGNTKADQMVYSFMSKYSIPGISVTISKDEEIVYSAGYGFADTQKQERVTPNHKFRLASMSKQQTAIAIMHLMEKGLLKLEDTVFGEGGILAEEFGNSMPEVWKTITIEHFLSHTSGINPDNSYRDCIFGSSIYSGLNADKRISLLLEKSEVKNFPGKIYHYNNSNFLILGRVVEKLSGKKFAEFLADEIYAPLEITGIEGGNNKVLKTNEVNYYGQNGKNPFGNDVETGAAAGGMIATTPALMQLMSYIDYGTKVPDIFKKETLDRMYTPLSGVKDTGGKSWDRYALGWRVNHPTYNTWDAYHGGSLAGVASIWSRSNDNINGALLCNSRNYDDYFDTEMWYLLRDIQAVFR